MLALLLATHLFYPRDAPLSRYDFLTLAALAIQAVMLATRLETWEEARVIFVFHVVGTAMEIFKTGVGSWIYPEEVVPAHRRRAAVLRLHVCLRSAAIIARVWRIFDFRFSRFPPLWAQGLLAVAIYVNFFPHHYWIDIRLGLFIASALIYGACMRPLPAGQDGAPMPLLVGLVLVALFIWFAENIGTFARAWVYPGQEDGWRMVSIEKLGSWYLLMIISFVLVAAVHMAAAGRAGTGMSGEIDRRRRRHRGSRRRRD